MVHDPRVAQHLALFIMFGVERSGPDPTDERILDISQKHGRM
jgi:hypothetical protein